MKVAFTPISNLCHNFYSNPFQRKNDLKCDVVSFSGKNFLEQSEDEIFEKIIKSLRDKKNFMGFGAEAEVFQIENTGYCVRLPYGDENDRYRLIDVCSDLSFELSEEDKINHIVAKLGAGATIMKKIPGKAILKTNMTHQEAIDSIKKVSEIPVSGYNKLLKQISHADKYNMVFDAYGTNVLADEQSLVAIDFMKTLPRYKRELKPLMEMRDALINIGNVPPKLEKAVLYKIFCAMLNEFEPNNKPCLELEQFDTLELLIDLHEKRMLNREQFELLWSSFKDLKRFKSFELDGFNASPELENTILENKKLLKEVFCN